MLDKPIISQFLRTDCRRQLKLGLYDRKEFAEERESLGMPGKQPQRPGFRAATDLGNEWETNQVGELHSHLAACRT
jgi:hypothetical protein